MVQVDLCAPTIPSQTRVWRLFPGQRYQFRQSFQDQRIGFLDFPGFEFPEGNLTEAADLIPRIARSQDIRELLWRIGPEAAMELNPANVPDLKLASYARAPVTAHRRRLRSALINFFQEAKTGDYVALPELTYLSKIWIGRFTTNERVGVLYDRRYGKVQVPARTIDWIVPFPENIWFLYRSRAH
jgi:hypothetical protein